MRYYIDNRLFVKEEQAHQKADVGATFTRVAQRHGLSQALISEPDADLLFKLLLACQGYSVVNQLHPM